MELKGKINSCICIRFDVWTINSPSLLYSLKNEEFWEIKDNVPSTFHAATRKCRHSNRPGLFPEQAQTTSLWKSFHKEAVENLLASTGSWGASCFRKVSRQTAEPNKAQAWGECPSLPSHTHKMESQLVKEKVYLIMWKPSSWLT